ncbi:MAG: hypothetical protein HY608_05990 [Planctomycetes bacterium]|nr:hypothetical protein [Planctomycetota bacterium]
MPPELFVALFIQAVTLVAPHPDRVVLYPYDGGAAVYEGIYRRDPDAGWVFVILADRRPGAEQAPAWSVAVGALKGAWRPSEPWPDEPIPAVVAETRGKVLRPVADADLALARVSPHLHPWPGTVTIRAPLPGWKMLRAWHEAARERAPAPHPVRGSAGDAAYRAGRERARVRGALPPR